jgi:hypothetical protein
LAAIAVAFLQDMINHMGVGWAFTLLGALCSLSGILFLVERQKGMEWRLARLGGN